MINQVMLITVDIRYISILFNQNRIANGSGQTNKQTNKNYLICRESISRGFWLIKIGVCCFSIYKFYISFYGVFSTYKEPQQTNKF